MAMTRHKDFVASLGFFCGVVGNVRFPALGKAFKVGNGNVLVDFERITDFEEPTVQKTRDRRRIGAIGRSHSIRRV